MKMLRTRHSCESRNPVPWVMFSGFPLAREWQKTVIIEHFHLASGTDAYEYWINKALQNSQIGSS
jgi:hypothetical protein